MVMPYVLPQKCNTAFYLLIFTKNTAWNPSRPSLPTAALPGEALGRPAAWHCGWPAACGLVHRHGGGPVDGLHHGRKSAAQVVRGVGSDLRGLFQHNDLSGAVQEPGQQLTQLHLQLCCQGERRKQSVPANGGGLQAPSEGAVMPFADSPPCPESCPAHQQG